MPEAGIKMLIWRSLERVEPSQEMAIADKQEQNQGQARAEKKVIQGKTRKPMWIKTQDTSDISSGAKKQSWDQALMGWALMLLDFIFRFYFHLFLFHIQMLLLLEII